METPSSGLVQLPLFPLNAVLFPEGRLPLQIFEPRYLDMIGRRHAAGEPFGVVCLSTGREIRTPGEGGYAPESLHGVGTLVRIDLLERPRPALMMMLGTGLQRFRIERHEQQRYGLWVADAELLPPDTPTAIPPDLLYLRDKLLRLVEEWKSQASGSEDIELTALETAPRWDDCGWLANRWCELLALGTGEKQRLLELDSPLLRLELVSDAFARVGF
ncbi:MAG: LON peptidase substrate-binding domain-containing protein [Pseudomonadota bacterium]|nr:LON peptidase substrate-binding domain-containing protein [Pseudomonadota bacterium]